MGRLFLITFHAARLSEFELAARVLLRDLNKLAQHSKHLKVRAKYLRNAHIHHPPIEVIEVKDLFHGGGMKHKADRKLTFVE